MKTPMAIGSLTTFIALALGVVGCGDDPASPLSITPYSEGSPDAGATMAASSEHKAAVAKFESCMKDAGYVTVDGGTRLKDGSILRLEVGQSYAIKGAYLDYRIDAERCDIESGMADLRRQFGRPDPTPDQARLKALNDQTVQEMGCMERKGWEIPEPKLSRGMLFFDVQHKSPEEEAAYKGDLAACKMELWGAP